MHITVWLFVHYFRPKGCPSVRDAPSFSLQFKSLQLLLFLSNCCLLIHGNSIGLRCEPVDTGVRLKLMVGGRRRICRCTSQASFHLDLDTVCKQNIRRIIITLFFVPQCHYFNSRSVRGYFKAVSSLESPPPHHPCWLMEKLDSSVSLSVVSLAMAS